MRYDHNYEFAFRHYQPDYLGKGQKHNYKYCVTACRMNGDYFFQGADNKKELEDLLLNINLPMMHIEVDSVAVQNRFGQLIWNSETGFADGCHPKYMDEMPIMNVNRCWRVQVGA